MLVPSGRRLYRVAVIAVLTLGCSDDKADAHTTSAPAETAPNTPYEPAYRDPLLKEVFVDVDEWRDEPVRHRYVHGGFNDSEARFSIYFPPADKYERRFFQYILPVSGNEHAVTLP